MSYEDADELFKAIKSNDANGFRDILSAYPSGTIPSALYACIVVCADVYGIDEETILLFLKIFQSNVPVTSHRNDAIKLAMHLCFDKVVELILAHPGDELPNLYSTFCCFVYPLRHQGYPAEKVEAILRVSSVLARSNLVDINGKSGYDALAYYWNLPSFDEQAIVGGFAL